MVSKIKRSASLCLITALVSGCATPTRTWVDPASITDAAKYETDFKECDVLAGKVMLEAHIEQRNSMLLGALGGALIGAALGSAIAPSGHGGDLTRYGAVAGAAGGAGGGAAAVTSPHDAAMIATRECLRGRGYHPIR